MLQDLVVTYKIKEPKRMCAMRNQDDEGNAKRASDLNKEQQLKAAMYYGIKAIAKEVEDDMDVVISPQVLATLSESLSRQAEEYATDLELFAKHAKRSNIGVEDVKLLARRNHFLLRHIDSIVDDQKAQKEATKKPRKTSSKSSKTASVADIEED